MIRFLTLLVITSNVYAGEYDTPEQAIKTLELAYSKGSIEKALEARDFEAEAKLMLLNINPELALDKGILKQAEDVLLLGTKQEFKSGLPNFSGLKCSLKNKTKIEHGVIQFNEVCIFPDQGSSEQSVYAFYGNNGWRYVAYQPKKP